MKVELNRPTLDSVASAQASKADISGQSPIEGSEEDKATLTTDRASLETLVAQAMTVPEVRQEKVAALRQAIQAGQYKVDPEKIADALIRDSQ